MKKECSTITNQKIISFSEKKSSITFNNPSQIKATFIVVDGCEVTTGKRCDYLMIANEIEHFIELKGQDLLHAIEQLTSSIEALSADAKKLSKLSYIICTRSPLNSAAIQNLQYHFKKKYNSSLIIKSSPYKTSL